MTITIQQQISDLINQVAHYTTGNTVNLQALAAAISILAEAIDNEIMRLENKISQLEMHLHDPASA